MDIFLNPLFIFFCIHYYYYQSLPPNYCHKIPNLSEKFPNYKLTIRKCSSASVFLYICYQQFLLLDNVLWLPEHLFLPENTKLNLSKYCKINMGKMLSVIVEQLRKQLQECCGNIFLYFDLLGILTTTFPLHMFDLYLKFHSCLV